MGAGMGCGLSLRQGFMAARMWKWLGKDQDCEVRWFFTATLYKADWFWVWHHWDQYPYMLCEEIVFFFFFCLFATPFCFSRLAILTFPVSVRGRPWVVQFFSLLIPTASFQFVPLLLFYWCVMFGWQFFLHIWALLYLCWQVSKVVYEACTYKYEIFLYK